MVSKSTECSFKDKMNLLMGLDTKSAKFVVNLPQFSTGDASIHILLRDCTGIKSPPLLQTMSLQPQRRVITCMAVFAIFAMGALPCSNGFSTFAPSRLFWNPSFRPTPAASNTRLQIPSVSSAVSALGSLRILGGRRIPEAFNRRPKNDGMRRFSMAITRGDLTFHPRVTIFGGGNFGLALALVLSKNNIPVTVLVRYEPSPSTVPHTDRSQKKSASVSIVPPCNKFVYVEANFRMCFKWILFPMRALRPEFPLTKMMF